MSRRLYIQKKVRQIHRWLGISVGIQFLAWTLGGLYFSWSDLDEIRSEHLKAENMVLDVRADIRSPDSVIRTLLRQEPRTTFKQIQLVDIAGKVFYQLYITAPEKKYLLFDAQTLTYRPPLTEQEAIAVATKGLKIAARPIRTAYISHTDGHHEYREKPLPAYAVTFGTPEVTVYVSAELGTIQAWRNNAWRVFDFLWMLHTMDYAERDHFNNWLLRLFSIAGLCSLLSGFLLYFLSSRTFIRMKSIIPGVLLALLTAACSQQPADHSQPRAVTMSAEDSLKMAEQIEKFSPDNHVQTMDMIFGKPKADIKTIGILVYDGVNDLDVMGPRYVLGQAMGVKTQLISIKPGNIRTVMGVEIVPNTVKDSVSQLDILIIPGGFTGTIEAAYDAQLHEWIRKIDKNTYYTGAVCTGVWVLGATGLLEGKKACTNWYREEEFLQKYKAIPAKARYVQDGKYWTSAGVTAGMDMALAIMADIYGDKYAQAIMLDMEYDPHPPIEGGTPEKTNWVVNWMMKAMYDGGVNPLIDSLERRNK